MKTMGDFISECGRTLAPFERLRVGRTGCFVALAAIAGALLALAAGARSTGGSWMAGFRFVVLSALVTVIVVFVGYAVAETLIERSVRRRVEAYLRETGTDLETLFRATEMRRAKVPGGERLAALLRDELS